MESREGVLLPLPPRLARLYGSLRMPPAARGAGGRPHVFSNFVTSLDGVVSLGVPGHDSGADISGFNAEDRMVMGLLRAVADVVVIGAGTLGADREHVWTAEAICPELAGDFARLRAALGKGAVPLNVVVSVTSNVDLSLPIFSGGKVPVLILTNPRGAQRFAGKTVPDTVTVRSVGRGAGLMKAAAILEAIAQATQARHRRGRLMVLVEGGPRLLGDFYQERLMDEQFLTLSPQIAGRDAALPRPSLVMGRAFGPRELRWARLTDLRRSRDHLFLRYAFTRGPRGRAGKAPKTG